MLAVTRQRDARPVERGERQRRLGDWQDRGFRSTKLAQKPRALVEIERIRQAAHQPVYYGSFCTWMGVFDGGALGWPT